MESAATFIETLLSKGISRQHLESQDVLSCTFLPLRQFELHYIRIDLEIKSGLCVEQT